MSSQSESPRIPVAGAAERKHQVASRCRSVDLAARKLQDVIFDQGVGIFWYSLHGWLSRPNENKMSDSGRGGASRAEKGK